MALLSSLAYLKIPEITSGVILCIFLGRGAACDLVNRADSHLLPRRLQSNKITRSWEEAEKNAPNIYLDSFFYNTFYVSGNYLDTFI